MVSVQSRDPHLSRRRETPISPNMASKIGRWPGRIGLATVPIPKAPVARILTSIRPVAGREVVQQVDGFPLLPLGGMHCWEDQEILVPVRNARVLAGRIGWVEREFRQDGLAGRKSGRDLTLDP